MGGKGGGAEGYEYELGMHMVLCHGPVDAVTHVFADSKEAWSGTNTGTYIEINKPNLFGGEKREGGIGGYTEELGMAPISRGRVDFDFGNSSQLQNSYLVSQLGSTVPAYRGVVSAVLNKVYIGMTPYLKLWKFRVRRTSTLTDGGDQWQPAYATINTDDMNPAHIIRECLTAKLWGMGYNSTDIDESSFLLAAQTLHSEGMGISLLWDKQTPLEDFIAEIVKHISGSLFVDKSTGRFKLVLVRDDYVVDDILLLDETNVTKVTDFTRPVVGELTNSVTVIYWDKTTGKNGSITVQDIALAQTQQGDIGITVQYPGFTNGELATEAASRDLRVISTPLVACTIYTTRATADLDVGSPFVLSWPDLGVESVVMRVVELAYGGVTDAEVRIKASQDVFAAGEALVAAPPATEWVSPVSDPAACSIRKGYCAPYWDVAINEGQAVADGLGADLGILLICAVSPTSDAVNASLRTVDSSGDYVTRSMLDFCPVADAAADIAITDTQITIENTVDFSLARGGLYIQIEDELMRLDSAVGDVITVGRGVLDTVPKVHPLGVKVYFNGGFAASDSVQYGIGESPGVKLTPITGNGELDVDLAPVDNILVTNRSWLPYAPGNFKINSIAYPPTVDETLDITFSWSHRDRKQQLSESLYDTTTGNIGPEAGVTYTLQVMTPTETIIQQWTGLTGTSQLIDVATLAANADIRVKLWAIRDSVASYQIHDFQFERVP